MFNFLAVVFSLAWIREHLVLVIVILAALLALIVFAVVRRRAKRKAYLALPVQFVGNASTKVYHAADCPQLSKVSRQNMVALRLPSDASRFGFRPCNICSPRWPADMFGDSSK